MKSLIKAPVAAAAAAARTWAADNKPAIAAMLRQGFDWAYGKAVEGMPGLDGAAELASRYQARHANADDAVRALIGWQTGIAGAAGFVTGCGGFAALPVALPANLASALYIQARLVAAIAHLRGHDIASDEVRTLALACLAGSKAAGTMRDAGVRLGTRMTRDAAGWVSPALFKKLRHASSQASLACGVNGVSGAARLAKLAPVLGGVIAGGFDAVMTRLIGHTADRVFAGRGADPAAG
jgi:EcsC protein family